MGAGEGAVVLLVTIIGLHLRSLHHERRAIKEVGARKGAMVWVVAVRNCVFHAYHCGKECAW